MQEFYGTHRITATFPDSGVVREVLVFPSLGDDESTSLEITPTRD